MDRGASGYGCDLAFHVGLLVFSAVLIWIICKQEQMGRSATSPADARETPRNLMESFRIVRQSPHLLAIAALILLSSVVTSVAGWQLKVIAMDTLVQKDMIASYLGAVAGYTGIVSVIAQLLITSKLLRRFGIGVALLVLPLSLTMGSLTVLIWGTLSAAAILRGSDGIFRYSIDTSAVQLLYLPVPANIKVQVKSFIDTVIWKFGDLLAAVTLLVFATKLHFTPRQISLVSLVLLAVWITAALTARRQYVATLKANIQHVRIQPQQVLVPVLDQFTTKVVAEKLNSPDPNEVIYALTLFEMGQQLHAHSAIRKLLVHPSPHVRKKAVSILTAAEDLSVKHQIVAMIRDNDLDVRTEALRYLSRHDDMDPLNYIDRLGDFADFSIRSATISFLMKRGEAQNLEAGRMILDGMIGDLENETLVARAANSMALLGDMAVGALQDHLANPNEDLRIRKQIPEILLQIGTSRAPGAFAENLVQAEAEVRFKVISALDELCEALQRQIRPNFPIILREKSEVVVA